MTAQEAKNQAQKPLVYSCSGCSSAAQMANNIAIQLDREGVAEMSCIAGVGGDVRKLVKVAKSGRPVIGIDGCPLACVKSALARHDVEMLSWHELSGYEVEKVYGMDFEPEQAEKVKQQIIDSLPDECKPQD